MDAFKILGLGTIPSDFWVGFTFHGDGSDEVLDKNGMVVGALGDVLFVRSFEEGKDFRTGTGFDEGNEVFDPNGFFKSNLEVDMAALVMGAAFADRLAAGAKGGDGDGDADFKLQILAME